MKNNILDFTFLKTAVCALLLSAVLPATAQPQPEYDQYFTPDRLRIDLVFAGDAQSQHVYLDGLKYESGWSGSKKNLIDPFGYGDYFLEIQTPDGEKTLYSKGFNTLFQEWRSTEEAKTTPRAFNSAYRVPFPKNKVRLVISERVKETGRFRELYSIEIDPADKLINREKENEYAVTKILYNGDPENKVDLLFVAEGYTAQEMEKFRADAGKFAGYLFETEPYKSRTSDFNIWAVESVSSDSGPDIPHHDIWKNTVAGANFYTFRIDRYMTAPDQRQICRLASNAPCDAIFVIVNTDKYGGGGIYNFYGLSMSDHPTEAQVFVHEFGHSFAGLGDEYYDSEVAYEDFYNTNTEPWEPNLTTLVDFGKKWKDMLAPGTPVPTPNDPKYGEPRYQDSVGVFEGGGYMAKGIYRPGYNCRMKANNAPGFCPVCRQAIEKMIDYYTK